MKLKSLIILSMIAMLAITNSACQKKGVGSASGLNRIHYDFDRASIRPDMAQILDANAQYLKAHPSLRIVVEGYCDERGTNEYNLALGDRRAKSAANYLETKGISDSRLNTMSYGEERPLEKGSNEAAWYKNRRAEFVR